MGISSQVAPEPALASRYEALSRVSQAIGAHHCPKDVFSVLARELRSAVEFDYLSILVHEERTKRVCNQVLGPDGNILQQPPDVSLEESPSWWVYQNQQALVIPRIAQETRFPETLAFLKEHGIQSICKLPIATVRRRLGCLGLGSKHADAYSEEEVRFLRLVADQVALAVENAINAGELQDAQAELQREKDRLGLLLDLTSRVVSNLELRDLLRAISASVRKVMECDLVGVALPDPESGRLWNYAFDFPGSHGFIEEQKPIPEGEDAPPDVAFRTSKSVVLDAGEIARRYPAGHPVHQEGIRSICCLPLISRERTLGSLNLARVRESPFTSDEVEFLLQVASQVAIAVENALAYRQIADLKDQLVQEKVYLEDEIRSEMNFDEIVGRSAALRRVLQQVETVAPTDSTVLIYGETGSGKELIARAIHNLSARKPNAFVKLNCAAIPAGLVESELFGHEKGAFTGAVAQRIGRFELANRGTVFLDEIGEIPLDLQPKLLRVLQEREFERLGSARTQRTDARLIAASNRDLATMVEEQKFRMDLFYRLNVFPVQVPPLRERQEDIPVLVRHFVQQFARRMKKSIDTISTATMNALTGYHWPGNIRELQNVIERAVILSTGPALKVPLGDLKSRVIQPPSGNGNHATLEEAERKHILTTLEETKWVLAGPNGAAMRLGMKRSTLQFRMRKLGISRPRG